MFLGVKRHNGSGFALNTEVKGNVEGSNWLNYSILGMIVKADYRIMGVHHTLFLKYVWKFLY